MDRLLDLLLPRFCLACASRIAPDAAALHLCRACRNRLVPAPVERSCPLCARPSPARRPLPAPCGPCQLRPPPWSRLTALWCYQPPLDAVIRAFKYHGLDFLGADLGRAAAERLAERATELDLVTPMPITPWRRLTRGFNQAERLATPLARRLGLPCLPLLARWGLPRPQAARGRAERLRLPPGQFRVRRRGAVAGRRVLLVDDVVTTGATARAAAAELLAAGALRVEILAAAWTPSAPLSDRLGPALTGLDGAPRLAP